VAAGGPATQRASLRPASTAASRPTPTGGRPLPAEVVWFCGICPGVVMTAMVADILKIDAAKTGMSIEEVTQRRFCRIEHSRSTPEDHSDASAWLKASNRPTCPLSRPPNTCL